MNIEDQWIEGKNRPYSLARHLELALLTGDMEDVHPFLRPHIAPAARAGVAALTDPKKHEAAALASPLARQFVEQLLDNPVLRKMARRRQSRAWFITRRATK